MKDASPQLRTSKPIKITYIIDVLDTDMAGTENQLIKLINGLDHNTFRIQLVCLSDHPWFNANASSLKCSSTVIEIRRFKKLHTYLNFLKLVRMLRRDRPDIVHTFFPVGNIVGVMAARLAGIKHILSSRRDYGEWMNGHYLTATKIANRFVGKIIANSTIVKDLTLRRENIKNGKVEVIYNGINAAAFENITRDALLKSKLDIPDNHQVVGIVANFRPMKHHYTFIKAAKEVVKHRDDVTFLLVGSGPLKEEIERLAGSLNMLDRLRFVGRQKEILPYLSIMDIGVNCSEAEGLSNAVMEYMAAGIACVVSDAGGNPDLITNDVNGYTFSLDDHQTLATLILRLLAHPATRDRFIKNAREKIRKEMSLEVMFSTYQTFYKSLIDV
jgi:glycosyltransferase involved in cell wall biosynthesis